MTDQSISTIPDLFLARHASPGALKPGIVYHLPPGPSLSAQGEEEADALADFLFAHQVKQIYVSPLERTLQTARIAHQKYAIPVTVREGLRELTPGESIESIRQRAWPVFEEAYSNLQTTGPATILTHGGVVHVLLFALGMSEEEVERCCVFEHHNPLPPAGAWKVTKADQPAKWNLNLVFSPHEQIVEVG
jgi:probable phosphoglycerate mutase